MENSTAIDMGIVSVANSDSVTSDSKAVIHNEEQTGTELGNLSTTIAGSTSAAPNSVYIHDSSFDMSCHGDKNNGDDNDGDENDDDGCYISDYEDNDDYMFENDDDDDDDNDDDYLNMQARFDNVDLPPGVEASVSWIEGTTSSINVSKKKSIVPPYGPGSEAETSVALVSNIHNIIQKNIGSSSSMLHVGSSSDVKTEVGKEHGVMMDEAEREHDFMKNEAEVEHDVMKNYELFKRFDTVNDYVDHYYSAVGFEGQQPPKTWTKKIHDEWKMLEKGLPDTIYVRVYETRMDLLRAIIVGPAGTPYHDGLFVFDVLFPPTYPDSPPMVYYYSGGLRLNPNLYDCGKVCLSLLNTWSGQGNEKWVPQTSTMLQVLVSIQALILNEEPFFNEPGYDGMYTGEEGREKSKEYNENAFILSLKTMMYTVRRPPKHFEDFVVGYYRTNARCILLACRAYMKGAAVGLLSNNDQAESSSEFKEALARMMNSVVSTFIRNGSKDCEEFRLPG